MIAGAVDCPGLAGIDRLPAHDIDTDSDLGDRLVTIAVPQLSPVQIDTALSAGRSLATELMAGGHIAGAVLELQGEIAVAGLDDPAAQLTTRQEQADNSMKRED